MQVSSQTNSYQAISANQQPVKIQPIGIEPSAKPELSPEKKLDITNNIDDKKIEVANNEQSQKDQQRENLVSYTGHQSKKTQVEIYLSVAADNKVDLANNDTIDSINTLRDIQKQNNSVAAYAAYQENQKAVPEPYLGA